MRKEKIKVFDAYSITNGDKKYYKNQLQELHRYTDVLYEYNNQRVDEDGYVSPNKYYNHYPRIKALDHNVFPLEVEVLEEDEKEKLENLKNRIKQAEIELEQSKHDFDAYERELIAKLDIDEALYEGEYWDCHLSPVGRCLYKDNGSDYVCAFCGEPEERK